MLLSRRSLLKVAACAPVLNWFPGWSLASTPGDRVALVIGNTAYKSMPLSNPSNDAQDMGTLLTKAGFDVTLQRDVGRESMAQAIAQFSQSLRHSGVKQGIFYYSGHGVQIDWKNFLIPVDLDFSAGNIADFTRQGIVMDSLLQPLSQAGGKSCVIILDACRDNPFGPGERLERKGLSQVDAPVGTLLAYSTAPGSTASDGSGRNGLYTSHLLRELAIDGVHIEDAMKRVRLNVRLASRGEQIPWESTSLEEDIVIFASSPPADIQSAMREELEKELSAWGRIKGSREPTVWADYLRDFPSGHFSEIAQERLDFLLAGTEKRPPTYVSSNSTLPLVQEKAKAEVGASGHSSGIAQEHPDLSPAGTEERPPVRDSSNSTLPPVQKKAKTEVGSSKHSNRIARERPDSFPSGTEEHPPVHDPINDTPPPVQEKPKTEVNPYSVGCYGLNRRFMVGDTAEFVEMDMVSSFQVETFRWQITHVDESANQVQINDGKLNTDLMGNPLNTLSAHYDVPAQFYPSVLQIGKRWKALFNMSTDNKHGGSGVLIEKNFDMKVVGRERITVPAGEFDTFRIEGNGRGLKSDVTIELRFWVVPGINFTVQSEKIKRMSMFKVKYHRLFSLLSYHQQSAT